LHDPTYDGIKSLDRFSTYPSWENGGGKAANEVEKRERKKKRKISSRIPFG
jgi:hypothetical protein